MNQSRLERMKPGAILINTARGEVIDEAALVQALRRVSSPPPGSDVYEAEPRVSPELLGMENVILLPHLAAPRQKPGLPWA